MEKEMFASGKRYRNLTLDLCCDFTDIHYACEHVCILKLLYIIWQYSEIWALDETDPFLPPEGGESVANVASRLSTAVTNIEAAFQG